MIRGLWDRETVALLLLAALLPMALTWLWFGGVAALGRLALALVISGGWHLVFMLARAQPPSLSGALAALAVAMLAPEDLGLVRLVLGISFGAVFGELVFGGWGRNVVHPATVTLAFLGFGFPAFPWPDLDLPVVWAALPAALIGVATEIRTHADSLVGGDFLARTPLSRLDDLPRYLTADLKRLEKAAQAPSRDAASAFHVKEAEDMVRTVREAAAKGRPDDGALQRLEHARWLLEEFRVSLFAQSLGTSEPVSAKRIRALLS